MVSSSSTGTSGGVGATGAGTGAAGTSGMVGIGAGAGADATGGGVSAGTSTASASTTTPPTTAPGVVPPPTNMIGVLQSLATLIRAQPVGEMRSTKALESCVQKMGRFVGREVSQYLREYRCAMEMYLVSDNETIVNFELVSKLELRDRIREIARRYLTIPGGWESFERAMREEYLDEDSDRITRRTFLDWIETQPGRTLGFSELKREFERRYSQLPLRERLTFDTRRTELFLRAADDVSTDRLCFMLADRVAEGGITSDWLRVDEVVSVLTKQRRVQYVAPADFPRVVEPRVEFPPRVVPHVPLMTPPIAPAAIPVQPRPEMVPQQPIAAPLPAAPRQQPADNKNQQNAIDDLTRQLRELRVEVAGLRQGPHVPAAAPGPARPRDGPRRCIWCDSVDHMRAECTDLAAAVRDRVVHYQDGRLHLTATGEPLMTRWGRGGMRSFLPRPTGVGVVVADPPAVVAAPVPARAVVPLHEANVFAGQAISASFGSSSTASSKISVEVLRRGTESIRRATGWNDFVDVNTIHAFLDNKKHVTWEDAIVEEKRRRDEAEIDTGPSDAAGPRVTRRRGGDIAADVPSSSRAPPPLPGPMEGVWHDVPIKGKAQKASAQEKNKAPAYKLATDIETSTDLKAILMNGILDARVEFSLRDILGIAKREFHELIIDVIKRKRQTVSEQVASQMTRVSDDTVADAVYDATVCVGEGEFGEEYVALVAGPATIEATKEDGEKGPVQSSDYKSEFWARATDEVKVQLGGLAEPITALVDTGSEINVMSRAVYERGQWPIDLHHGWALRSANGVKKEMYGACPFIPVRIGNVEVTQHFFVQENAPIPVILGQPYITAVRLETKVLNDGSHFARIRSLDDLFTPVERDNGSGSLAANIPFEHKTDCRADLEGWRSGVVTYSVDGYSCFRRLEDLSSRKKTQLEKQTEKLRCTGVLSSEENISGVFEENVCLSSVADWCDTVNRRLEKDSDTVVISLHSRELYEEIVAFLRYRPHPELEWIGRSTECWCNSAHEVEVHAKYKSVLKKVKPVATQLPGDSEHQVELAAKQPDLRDVRRIGHKFTPETLMKLKIGGDDFLTDCEKKKFEEMIRSYEKVFSFSAEEIGCVDPKVIAPMVIFTVLHVPWDLKPIPVPRAMLPKLINLLKEKMRMGILEPSMAPYSSRWFTILKKNGSLRFIQDLQPANSVTIRNVGTGPIIDDVVDEFAGRAIYSVGDLYSGYDQFQLAVESRDLTTIRTPLGLMRMCTLPQGATNSVAHMQNAMHKVLREFVPEITIPFLDDIPMKGCATEEKDETLDATGCRNFVSDHIRDVGKILNRLREVHLSLSGEKSRLEVPEILVVGHVCDSFGRRPNPVKVEAIDRLADCKSTTEVRRFLGGCVFFRLSIPHYAHAAEPLYALLKKGKRFSWSLEHHEAMEKLKRALQSPLVLRRLDFTCGRSIIVTVDTSPRAVGWAIGQDDADGVRFAKRFGAKILTGRQRDYSQVKRELWDVYTALRTDRNFLIGAAVMLETDCLPLLGIIANCSTPDITMPRWIAYVRNFNPQLKHIAGKKNVVADMLSRARYEGEEEMVLTAEEEERREAWCQISVSEVLPFSEYLYSGRLRDIGFYLSSLEKREDWSDAEFKKIRQKAYGFLLREGYLWKRPKRRDGECLRVVDDEDTKLELLKECHEALWAGHRGVWATYMKLKERYWWKGMYSDVDEFVGSCLHCQFYSKVRHRDGLVPTFPPSIHFRWVLDLVMMPPGLWGMRYLVLAREDLSKFVEGRALRTKSVEGICRFVLEDIVCRYGSVGSLRADRGDLNAEDARTFFRRYGVDLKLTTAMNPEGIGKSERGHPPIVHALVKACNGKPKQWPRLLPFALWADRSTHCTTTGYMPVELILGQKPILPIEDSVLSWVSLPWEDGVDHETLLVWRIRQLERREEDLADAHEKLKQARLKNKFRFDKTHRLRPKPIQPGDWVLVYDSSLENQHSTVRKFSRRWFGPYVVLAYSLREVDGTVLRLVVAGKRVKLFNRRNDTSELFDFLDLEHGPVEDDYTDEENVAEEKEEED
ncbi:hypothetical protein R1sor_020314 [Riccia sorocarpa]|uniref:Reverse transcriptase n=1 Tax=Riccia sorocarpa TaxID=122646 RepID=A0ABD3IHS9_9MARC